MELLEKIGSRSDFKELAAKHSESEVLAENVKITIQTDLNFKPASEILNEQQTVIYTVGYEGRSIINFIDVLKSHRIKLLVDVRELPLSRKNGFSKTKLKEFLKDAGILYLSFRELGTPKDLRHELKDRNIRFEEFRKLYIEYLNEHLDAIKRLENLAKSNVTVIMCYERNWKKCHRSIIAEYLEKEGFKVIHL